MTTAGLTAVELFAGGGGLALGTHRAGFSHVALLERNEQAVETLDKNIQRGILQQPDYTLQPTDVRTFDYDRLPVDHVDLLSAGAPCQPFSLGGNHKGEEDSRNLFPEVFRAQRYLHPNAFLLENVRGLMRSGFRPYLEYILLQLAAPGIERREQEGWRGHKDRVLEMLVDGETGDHPRYDVHVEVLQCADYGVPQRRSRVFIVGFRTDLGVEWKWPTRTHSDTALHHAKYVNGEYWREHSMERDEIPEEEREKLESTGFDVPSNGKHRWRTVRDLLSRVPDPVDGEQHSCHPNHVGVPGAKKYPGHTGSPLDEPAKTLKAGVHGVPGGENMLRRPNGSVRYFTVYEASLFQTFPEDYVFVGSRTSAMWQVGNAAPVRVCEVLGERIAENLEGAARKETPARGGEPRVDLVGDLDQRPLTFA